ncbi:tubulin epsilon and delta complex protein 1 isoform X2 [Rousettus aegyptiacus]|uniref:Tubulin epsilon and delta complex 1 n=1 Tax=Rousettus aegyptiacus TaxID=9407 RepID=A0A7J8B7E0_ROUAE|nr:tubulin epsilon and delta complex protein 1 isoform X2 [Rousettus aegyptiacus]KAF6394431.1 tubulin epsilon and delta complex 1 [Rousettus aegyptiacus]
MGRRRHRADRAGAAGALPEAIAALSRALPAGPSPETFRRAKFDRPEAAPALWQLLFSVLSQLRADSASASLSPEVQARWVKSALRSQGYPRLAQFPKDGSQGSRELLLALSWLLAGGALLERLLAQTCVRLGDEMPACECEALASPGRPAPRVEADSCAGRVDVRHLQWLMGKLRFRWRSLMASQQEQCALLGKIHSYTHGCHSDRSLGHLSITETELLRDPEYGRQLLQRLERENARLEAALEWRRREPVFWQWMDTVLGACPPEASQPAFVPGAQEHRADELALLAWELRALQEELRAAAEARRAAWAARVRGQGPDWDAAQRATQEAVAQELAALRQAWERGGGLAQPHGPHGPHRLVRSEAGLLAGPGLRAAEVIGALRSQEACLEVTLCQLQGRCRQELARLAGAAPGLIWIPPPGR